MLIQVDVDSTLYDANSLFYEVGSKQFGIDWPSQYNFWFRPEDIGTDLDTLLTVFRTCHSEDCVRKQKPFPYASEILNEIAKDYPDAEIAYVSDRSEELRQPLHDWLEWHGFLTNPDQHVAVTNDKRVWMRENRPDIVIDDRVRTMLMARYELGAQVLSLELPYNVNLKGEADGIYILPTWLEIGKTLREIVIPKIQNKDKNFSVLEEVDKVVR
jgi:hypothetical protein